MPYKTKLSEQQKEYVCVLGRFVGPHQLAKEFDVSISTILNLKRKTGVKYIDNYKKCIINANKTYQTSSDPYIKDKITELVFSPIARKVVRIVGKEITLRPNDGYIKLYQAIFGGKTETKKEFKEEYMAGRIIGELSNYISTSQFVSEYRLFSDLKTNLTEKLASELYKPLPSDLKERFDNVLSTLNEREAKVLRFKFGLDDGYSHTLRETGNRFNLTKQGIKHIEAKALRKLRHPTRSKKIKELEATYLRYLNYLEAPEEEHQKKKNLENELELWESQIDNWISPTDLKERLKGLFATHRHQLGNYYIPSSIEKSLNYSLLIGLFEYVNSLETKIDALRRGEVAKLEVEKERSEFVELEKKLAMSIHDFEFSVRSYNCLREARIKTVRDLVQKTEEEILQYRNFGKKSLVEINEVLAKMGLSLGMKFPS